jgi:hypothetical protein
MNGSTLQGQFSVIGRNTKYVDGIFAWAEFQLYLASSLGANGRRRFLRFKAGADQQRRRELLRIPVCACTRDGRMMTREQAAEYALTWEGTPYRRGGS